MFNWPRLLEQHRITYRRQGNTDIEVHCPFCGQGDPSLHMSISLAGRGWSCWRNASHRGRNNARLIQALLRCSWEQACQYAGKEPPPSAADEDVAEMIAGMLGQSGQVSPPPKHISLAPEFKPLNSPSPLAAPFWDYMFERGFQQDEIEWLAVNYALHYATKGLWRYRVVIPITDSLNHLMTWTARSILSDDPVRYRTLSAAVKPPGDLLLGLPLLWNCKNPRALVLCEGPFDALRISAAGAAMGVYGTCFFGLRISDEQARLVEELKVRFPRIFLVLDQDAELKVFSLMQRLRGVRCRIAHLPDGVKDPGDLASLQAKAFVGKLLAA